jgi:GT2 family glycosyltransferase
MLLNSDARLKADGLARLFEFMEDSESRQYWACGGLLFQEDGSPQHSFFPWVSDVWGDMRMVLSRIYHAILTGKWYIDGCPRPKEKPLDVDHVTGAALFFRRQVNEQNLSFDEKFFMYSEDSELSFRMKQIGFRAAVLPSVRILHVRGSSSRTNDLFLLMRLMEVDSRFRLSRQSAGRVMEFIDRAIHGTYYLFSFLLRGGVLSRELLLLTLNVKKLDDRPDFQMLKQGIVPVGPMNSSVEP